MLRANLYCLLKEKWTDKIFACVLAIPCSICEHCIELGREDERSNVDG